MNLFILLFVSVISIFSGKPAANTRIYLEKGAQETLIAFQLTGIKGAATFNYLDAASYRLVLVFPQQEGKYIAEKPKYRTLTKATYNPSNKTYYYKGIEGYFSIKFSGLSSITGENFDAVFKEEPGEELNKCCIAEFGAHKSGASISLTVKAITAADFKKAADKIGQDISTQSIQGIK